MATNQPVQKQDKPPLDQPLGASENQQAKDVKGSPRLTPEPPQELLPNTLAYRELRYRFAGIALAEIVKWQVAEHKAGQEDVAASWAFRYADRMMAQAMKRPSLQSLNVRGVPGVTEEPIVEVQ